MTLAIDEDDDETRPRILSNTQILGYIGRHWLREPVRFTAACTLVVVAACCDLTIPWASRGLMNAVSNPHRVTSVAWAAWAALSSVYALQYATRSSTFRILNGFYSRIMSRMVNEGFQRVQSFSTDWHASNFAGATVRRVSRAMWGYDSASDALLLMLAPTLIVMVGLVVSFSIHWPLEGLFVAVVVGGFAIYNVTLAVKYIRPANLASNALDSRIGGALADAIGANPVVKSFGAEAREEARFDLTVQAWRKAVNKTWDRFNNVGMGQNLFVFVLQAGLTGLMVRAWSVGKAGPEDVVFAITSFIVMAGYMRNFSDITRMLQKGLDDTQDVASYMLTPPQLADPPGAPAFRGEVGEVRMEGVCFSYKSAERRLYDGFSLTIRPGERIALVGPTGSGKSTFVKLLQRLYDLEAGRIVIDGQDIARVRQDSLRRSIAVVPQDPALFHRTIAENIGYARPDATAEEIALAARRARAHDFIAALPKGYETLVGERGVKLSGGERQRVAIARAFLADAPILVLDEATSSLDVETEVQVQAATEELMAGRTTIVIAHRLSTIRSADRILVFEGGRIVEEGRHGELVAKGGAYARLHAVTQGA
jgi:ATP-binding cassette, subfamily B, bacterial